jgi:murein DD-endopeptidase MepM/ murein hydrolase activator NlpD
VTEADYLAGVRATIAAAADLGAGEISATGWARPAAGRITSGFGYRVHPKYGTWRLHTGTDIGAACNNNIYAAHSGTVVYAGWYGTYGNWVLIDNGDGISTGYAHIVNGGIKVQVGQEVGVGQPIAKVGTTGASTGCHLHYEVRINGVATDSVPFMRNQGITIG